MQTNLSHIFSVKDREAKHWRLVRCGCDLGDEYPDVNRQRELEEEVSEHLPDAEVKYLTTAENAETVRCL